MGSELQAVMAMGGAVWVLTELVHKALPLVWLSKPRLALVSGLALGLAAHGSGQVLMGAGAWGWVNAGLAGLLATATAAYANDRVVKPVQQRGGP